MFIYLFKKTPFMLSDILFRKKKHDGVVEKNNFMCR